MDQPDSSSFSSSQFLHYCAKLTRSVYFDYYNILGVTPSATQHDIKKAYKLLALQYHPDRCCFEKKDLFKEKFKILSSAYQTLVDPNLRDLYDNFVRRMALKRMLKNGDLSSFAGLLKSSNQHDVIEILSNHFNLNSISGCNFKIPFDLACKIPEPYSCKKSTPAPQSIEPLVVHEGNSDNLCREQPEPVKGRCLILQVDEMQSEDEQMKCTEEVSFEEGYSTSAYSQASSPVAEKFYSKFSFLNAMKNEPIPKFEHFNFLKDVFNNNNDQQQPPQSFSSSRFDNIFSSNCDNAQQEQQINFSSDKSSSDALRNLETLQERIQEQQQRQVSIQKSIKKRDKPCYQPCRKNSNQIKGQTVEQQLL